MRPPEFREPAKLVSFEVTESCVIICSLLKMEDAKHNIPCNRIEVKTKRRPSSCTVTEYFCLCCEEVRCSGLAGCGSFEMNSPEKMWRFFYFVAMAVLPFGRITTWK